jgi:hypothetical protein
MEPQGSLLYSQEPATGPYIYIFILYRPLYNLSTYIGL